MSETTGNAWTSPSWRTLMRLIIHSRGEAKEVWHGIYVCRNCHAGRNVLKMLAREAWVYRNRNMRPMPLFFLTQMRHLYLLYSGLLIGRQTKLVLFGRGRWRLITGAHRADDLALVPVRLNST